MAELTIGEARNSFSALIAGIASGKDQEHVIKRRDVPVARIVPAAKAEAPSRPFGVMSGSPLLADDAVFDALDDEIAKEFGI